MGPKDKYIGKLREFGVAVLLRTLRIKVTDSKEV
jgi:hypothetical protein